MASVEPSTRSIDRDLAEIASSFDLLVMVSPNNLAACKEAFLDDGTVPDFVYEPLPSGFGALHDAVASVDVDACTQPLLRSLFERRRHELSLQLALIEARNTPAFLSISQQLYGEVGPALKAEATEILANTRRRGAVESMSAPEFARRVEAELALLRESAPDLDSSVEIRTDIAAVMVANGQVMIPESASVALDRVEALVQHEIGTHVVTHHNGRHQELELMAAGLARYGETQEGLAVLMEYLVGGLTMPRLRTFAGRILAVDAVTDGLDFPQVVDVLRSAGFSASRAFSISARVWRSGGFTKDAIYLRGLRRVLDHLADGGLLRSLFVGKVALEALPDVDELISMSLVSPPALLPPCLDDMDVQARLDRCRRPIALLDLLEETP